jgi:hypothetical protein
MYIHKAMDCVKKSIWSRCIYCISKLYESNKEVGSLHKKSNKISFQSNYRLSYFLIKFWYETYRATSYWLRIVHKCLHTFIYIILTAIYLSLDLDTVPLPVTARSKAWACGGRSFVGVAALNPTGGMHVCLVQCLVCQVEVSATGRSRVQRSPTECGVSECDREPSIMRRPWHTGGCCVMERKNVL